MQPRSLARARSRTGASTVLRTVPLQIRVRERLSSRRLVPVENKWIYVFASDSDGCRLAAEIYAVDEEQWLVDYEPDLSGVRNPATGDRSEHPGIYYADPTQAIEPEGLRFLITPCQLTSEAIRYLVRGRNYRCMAHRPVAEDADLSSPVVIPAYDPFAGARRIHGVYLEGLRRWRDWLGDEDRQGRLFIATTLRNWIGENDPADVSDDLADGQPDAFLEEYEREEKRLRASAERRMRWLAQWIEAPAHRAVEMSAQPSGADQDPEAVAAALLQWGTIAQEMLATAPGRIFADKLFEDGRHFPATHVFSEVSTPPIPHDLVFGTFKGTWKAALDVFNELLAAKVRRLRDAASEGALSSADRVQRYLRNLAVETELRGTYRFIHENLERGRRPSAGLRSVGRHGRRRARILRSYQRLVRDAEAEVPRYTEQAQRELSGAGRYEGTRVTAQTIHRTVTLALNLYALCTAVDDYRNAFPDARNKKLISLASASMDLAGFGIEVTVAAMQAERTLAGRAAGSVAGGLGFVTGVYEMLDKEEQAVNSWMVNHDYDAAIGQGIAMTGAAISAVGGGIAVAEMIGAAAGLSLFGGPVGLAVGVIGAAITIGGSWLAWWLTDTEYETFASHCCFAEDPDDVEATHQAWSNHGSLSPRTRISTQVAILFDLLSKFSVNFVATARRPNTLPRSTTTVGTGYKLTIRPGYFDEADGHFEVDVSVRHGDEQLLHVQRLHLPDDRTRISRDENGRISRMIRTWSREELHLTERYHYARSRFEYTVKLKGRNNLDFWKPVRERGVVGGQTRTFWGQYEWNNVEVD